MVPTTHQLGPSTSIINQKNFPQPCPQAYFMWATEIPSSQITSLFPIFPLSDSGHMALCWGPWCHLEICFGQGNKYVSIWIPHIDIYFDQLKMFSSIQCVFLASLFTNGIELKTQIWFFNGFYILFFKTTFWNKNVSSFKAMPPVNYDNLMLSLSRFPDR